VFHSALDALEQAEPTLDALSEQDHAEFAEYNVQVAGAWQIHNKYHSNAAGNPNNDRYSDLSVLASSFLNGIEGIETSGSSKVQDSLGGASEVKVSRYGTVLRKTAN
jgi:hypothetical protein